jgi:hypothetical protein
MAYKIIAGVCGILATMSALSGYWNIGSFLLVCALWARFEGWQKVKH